MNIKIVGSEIKGAVISNKSMVTVTDNSITGNMAEGNKAILCDIADAQSKLADTQPLIASALEDLRKAIEQGDNQTKAEKIKALSVGAAVDVLTGVAGSALSHLLGIG